MIIAGGKLHPAAWRAETVDRAWSLVPTHYAPSTRSHIAAAMRRCIERLIEAGAPASLRNVVPRVHKGEPRQRVATEAERRAILNGAPLDLRLFILLCSDLALRSGTACSVAPAHRDSQRNEIRLQRMKHGASIVLPLTDNIVACMDAVPPDTPERSTKPYVLLLSTRNQDVQRLAYNYRSRFLRLCKRLNITDLRPHDLRRTTAEKVYGITSDLRVVQGLLGHRNMSSTTWYLQRQQMKPSQQLVEAAAEYADTTEGGE